MVLKPRFEGYHATTGAIDMHLEPKRFTLLGEKVGTKWIVLNEDDEVYEYIRADDIRTNYH